ncbi:hypothetical protein HYPSUDRAFT_1090837 [Hypholoma sublateritium FD-334 SS-4]|uniref:Cytochrome P450 n=1 Tax=Hypholoma sublateritium (strain FD-334 SS-4) TaxID=945553 RepID=A0A0D2PL23_HYPSF|nr:hypothetical protein HYPSUDRAFT_1090837 [Hypholoma sublateritium FD-334 SS-4]
MEWEKTYHSSILHACCLGQHFLILNSLDDAEVLLDKRADMYSDRPDIPVIDKMGWSINMTFMRHRSDRWRKHRRFAQQNFRQDAVSAYHEIQTRHAHVMLKGLLDTPECFEDHNKAFSVGVSMSIMYGNNINTSDDSYSRAAYDAAFMAFKLMLPTFTLLNFFPALSYIPAWFPMAVAQRMVRDTKRLTGMLAATPIEAVKNKLINGEADPCIVSRFLEAEDDSEEREDIISGVSFTVYTAASDTTISATSTFLYLMATHPEIQEKAQAEIDRVVGVDQLPGFEDRHSLPYIDAIYREVLRWKPPTPIGIPHRAEKDDIYKGYYIPEGTVVISNIWAMVRDEKTYPEAKIFKPERFIGANGELTNDDRVLTSGFGRRVCVGKHVASASLWIAFVSILATFNITKAKDADGRDIEVNDEYYDTGIMVHKKPFKCSILPRSRVSQTLIQQAMDVDRLQS